MATTSITKSQVNRAGRILRRWMRGPDSVISEDLMAAARIITEYRAAHNLPLTKANMGLRSMVRTEQCTNPEISQCLKRMTSIIVKLSREPNMAPAKMQDIAGCRAVLATIDELRRVQKRLTKNRPPLAVNDYVTSPRASGYRGVHVMVDYDGRCIEVQLRTAVMHDWAVTVERVGGRTMNDLKAGIGPEPVLSFFSAVSEAMALEEAGEVVDTTHIRRIGQLREDAAPFLREGSP